MARKTIRDAAALVAAGLAPAERLEALQSVAARYALAITPEMAALIDPADPDDPIALQFAPRAEELERRPDELTDPIGDAAHSPVAGVVHRYRDRVLLTLLHACPVYCRFCFRRESVGPNGPAILSKTALAAALAYVRSDPRIWEVILTGGDPLALAPRRLAAVLAELARIDHVRIVRIHTRVPLVDPARIDAAMIAALRAGARPVWIALHANHAREFTPAGEAAIARLVDSGVPMVSQSVLLRGVNDNGAALAALMRRFVENRIKPYYLHHLDRAPGTARFRVSIAEGQALMKELRGAVSGLCQPVYALDIPGGHGKAPIGPSYLKRTGRRQFVADRQGRWRSYEESAPAQRKPHSDD